MPKCQTKYQGETDYDEQAVLEFPLGLFGFETETRFVRIDRPALRPLIFLQSLLTQDLCFISLPVSSVDPEYSLTLRPEDLAEVGLVPRTQPEIGKDVECMVIVSIQPGGPTTANLMAPIVVNRKNSKAIQAVSLNQEHTHQARVPSHNEELVCS